MDTTIETAKIAMWAGVIVMLVGIIGKFQLLVRSGHRAASKATKRWRNRWDTVITAGFGLFACAILVALILKQLQQI